jgi:hypothetical protein
MCEKRDGRSKMSYDGCKVMLLMESYKNVQSVHSQEVSWEKSQK